MGELKTFVFDILNRSYEVVRQQIVYARSYEDARGKVKEMTKSENVFDVRLVY